MDSETVALVLILLLVIGNALSECVAVVTDFAVNAVCYGLLFLFRPVFTLLSWINAEDSACADEKSESV